MNYSEQEHEQDQKQETAGWCRASRGDLSKSAGHPQQDPLFGGDATPLATGTVRTIRQPCSVVICTFVGRAGCTILGP
jgi:hypothetical protein